MSFGGPLLKRKSKSQKISISQAHLFTHLEPILRTLGYVKPGEMIVEITSSIPKNIPIVIKKEVFKLPDVPSKSPKGDGL